MKNWYVTTFADLLIEIESRLRAFFTDRPQVAPLFREMTDHHFGWHVRQTPGSLGGKRIRPLLVLLVARALTGRHSHAMPAALALEIIHNFTLIHDDVMDESTERRHRETLWVRWGMAQAINAGDGLYALGMQSLLDLRGQGARPEQVIDAMNVLLKACVATVEGQMLDVSFEQRTDVTPDEYLTMIAGKSGALIEASTRLGALLSTDDRRMIDAYADFGRNLGLAFQIWDDYLGVWGEAESTGKSATSDIEGKKQSYPVLLAFQQADEPLLARLQALYAQERLSPADVREVYQALETVGSAQQTRDLIEVYFQRALAALDSVAADNDDHRHLRELALFLVERAY